MTPSEASKGSTAGQGEDPLAVSAFDTPKLKIPVLSKRRDFLAAARARKQGTKGMMVQGRKRSDTDEIRVGFTCSKKVGNAVARNRAKRRLREVARDILPKHGLPGWDYVLIGRATETDNRPFESLKSDLVYALRKIHGK